MQGPDVVPPVSHPRWRIVTACLMFFLALLSMLDGFRFEWTPWFCFGLYCLLEPYFLRRRGDTVWATLKKPQGIAAFALLAAAIVGMGRNIYMIFEKYR